MDGLEFFLGRPRLRLAGAWVTGVSTGVLGLSVGVSEVGAGDTVGW